MSQRTAYPATAKQVSYARRLYGERLVPDTTPDMKGDARAWTMARDLVFDDHAMITAADASTVIDWLKTLPEKPDDLPDGVRRLANTDDDQGVYQLNGTIYVVKLGKPKPDRNRYLYAMALTQAAGDRLSEAGTVIRFDREYAPGILRQLTTADRMALADAQEVMARYGRCLYCNAALKAAGSVARMVGPVCAKRFRI